MSSKSIANLTLSLQEIQDRENLKDWQMAERLGCKRQHWQMTRTGDTPLGMTLLKGIAKGFPELHQDIIYFLDSDADRLSKECDRIPLKQHSEAQGRALKRFCGGLIGRLRRAFSN